jgi:hypothetical protein
MNLYRISGWMTQDGIIYWTWRYKANTCGVIEVRWNGTWEALDYRVKVTPVYENSEGKPYTR